MAHILLVEDDVLVRDMVIKWLEWEGYQVVTATNGAQAIALAQANIPDLILMDMRLPGVDGLQAAQQLKASPSTAAVPIIALTAQAMPEERARGLAAGCDDYETKPIEFPQLLAKMRRFLARNSSL